ncbi:MAG TPA: MmgE/PrpD family protein [Xanthobacteraceae bacterium]|nr:MmgE/PrpD family protein [Xanthobacteraceae bacterium]
MVQASPDGTSLSRQLAHFASSCRWDDIPAEVRHEAKRSILNYFACALGGAQEFAVRRSLKLLDQFSGPRSASVVGHPIRLDPLSACFVNGLGGNVLDFDDTHIPTIMHPTAPIVAPLLAYAQDHRVSGEALLHAFIVGFDVACRIGNAVAHGGHYRRGWHITATCGVFGSATGVAKLTGLSVEQFVALFAAAGGQASGLVANLGTTAKSISVGNAARNGYLAALLVGEGFAGSSDPIEGRHGFIHVSADNPDMGAITRNLGSKWEISANTYKPYPTGVVLNPVIDACLELRAAHDVRAADIASIHVLAHPLLFERTDRPNVTSGREAVVSLQHTVAVVMCRGAADQAQFTDEVVRDADVLSLRSKVHGTGDDSVAVGAAHVSLRMQDGRSFTSVVTQARGSLERPLTDEQLEQKLVKLAGFGAPWCDTRSLIDALWTLDRNPDIASIMALAVPAT